MYSHLYIQMIRSFQCQTTESIFNQKSYLLNKKERKRFGDLDTSKAHDRLRILNAIRSESELLLPINKYLYYHAHSGSDTSTIDANKRRSKWRICFEWHSKELGDTMNVSITDPH